MAANDFYGSTARVLPLGLLYFWTLQILSNGEAFSL